jgi:hypothetical protein
MSAETWNIVGAVGQAVSAALTGAAVWYAARQIGESNRAQRTSQYQAAVSMMLDWRSDILQHSKIGEWLGDSERGSTYFHDVIKKYGAENYFHTVKLFHIFEFLHILHEEKVITSEMWSGWEKNLELIVTSQDMREIWSRLKGVGIFEDKFELAVDRIVARATAGASAPLAKRESQATEERAD